MEPVEIEVDERNKIVLTQFGEKLSISFHYKPYKGKGITRANVMLTGDHAFALWNAIKKAAEQLSLTEEGTDGKAETKT